MVKAPENRSRDDAPAPLRCARPGRWMEVEGPVGPRLVVVRDELLDDTPQMPFTVRNDVIQALAA